MSAINQRIYGTNKLKNNQQLNYPIQKQTRATNDSQVYYLWLATKAKTTVSTYTSALKSFRKVIDAPLMSITFDDLVLYQQVLQKKGLKPNTIANHLRGIKSLLSFAHEIGYITVNVGKAMSVKPYETLHERIIQPDILQKLIDSIGNSKHKMLISLMGGLGLRVSEVGQIKWADFRDNILSVTGKGNKTRHLIVPDELLTELRKLYHPNNTYVFETRNGNGLDRTRIHRLVKKYCKQAGIDEKVSSHWLRHCFATTSLKNGAPIKLVSTSLGHSSIGVTDKYLHVNPDECASQYVSFNY